MEMDWQAAGPGENSPSEASDSQMEWDEAGAAGGTGEVQIATFTHSKPDDGLVLAETHVCCSHWSLCKPV